MPRHRVSPFGEPDDGLRRGIQYSEASRLKLRRRGVLDRPLSRTTTPEPLIGGRTMTSELQKLIVLAGLPCSGKSTLAEGLSRSLSVPIFSIDPIEAAMWRGGLAKAQTGIAAYDVAIGLADEHLRLGHSVIVDAVNPVEAPRAAWRNVAKKYRAGLKII